LNLFYLLRFFLLFANWISCSSD